MRDSTCHFVSMSKRLKVPLSWQFWEPCGLRRERGVFGTQHPHPGSSQEDSSYLKKKHHSSLQRINYIPRAEIKQMLQRSQRPRDTSDILGFKDLVFTCPSSLRSRPEKTQAVGKSPVDLGHGAQVE